jgi:hypothetical protein
MCYNINMNTELPQSVKFSLWSYDTDKIDLKLPDYRSRIILNRGTSEAVSWLMGNFSKKEISEVIQTSVTSEWNKKSLSLWSMIFKTYPARLGRFA